MVIYDQHFLAGDSFSSLHWELSKERSATTRRQCQMSRSPLLSLSRLEMALIWGLKLGPPAPNVERWWEKCPKLSFRSCDTFLRFIRTQICLKWLRRPIWVDGAQRLLLERSELEWDTNDSNGRLLRKKRSEDSKPWPAYHQCNH